MIKRYQQLLILGISFLAIFWPAYDMLIRGYYIHDLAHALYNGREIAAGRIPHRDIWNHHVMGYALPFALLELSVGITSQTVAALVFIYKLIFVFFTSKSAELLSGTKESFWVAFLLSSVIGLYPRWAGFDFNNQSFLLPIIAIVLWLAIKGRKQDTSKLLGLIYGIAIMCDQRLLFLGFIVLWFFVVTNTNKIRAITSVSCCAAIAPLTYISVMLFTGGYQDFIFQTIVFPTLYRNEINSPWNFIWIRSAVLFLAQHTIEELSLLVSISFLLCWRRALDRSTYSLLLVTYLFALFYALAGGRTYYNYMLVFASPTLLTLTLLMPVFVKTYSHTKLGIAAAISVLSMLFLITISFAVYMKKTYEDGVVKKYAKYIQANSSSLDNILVLGYCPQIYVLSQRFAPHRDMGFLTMPKLDLHDIPFNGGMEHVARFQNEFVADMHSFPPKFIIMPTASSKPRHWGPSGCVFPLNVQAIFDMAPFFKVIHDNYNLIMSDMDGEVPIGLYERNI